MGKEAEGQRSRMEGSQEGKKMPGALSEQWHAEGVTAFGEYKQGVGLGA